MTKAAEAALQAGLSCQQQGRLDDAVGHYQAALGVSPDLVPALANLALALCRLNRPEQALPWFDRLLALVPADPPMLCCQAAAFKSLGRLAEAVAAADRALAVRPDYLAAAQIRAKALLELGRADEAEAAFRAILSREPGNGEAWGAIAAARTMKGDGQGAVFALEEAERRAPGHYVARLAFSKLKLCHWAGITADLARVAAMAPHGLGGGTPFTLLPMPLDAKGHHTAARAWSERSFAVPAAGLCQARPRQRGERLCVGYLSADFHPHAVSRLLVEVLERHDRARFDIRAYGYGALGEDPFSRRLLAPFSAVTDLRALSHADAARRIAADKVDILVDLTGYTRSAHPQILALRPAPIQVSYLGFPGTMGAPFIDYIVADPYLVPFEQQPFYTEKIVHLPHCYQPGDTRRTALPTSRAAEGLPEEGTVLAAFNNTNKITPAIFSIWMRLLARHPKAVLWLFAEDAIVKDNLAREAMARGVDPARLVFARHAGFAHYLGRLALADLFLDCHPYTAGATANDALWMGLPLLTCEGATYVGRMAASLLSTLGLPDLIAADLADYEARADALLAAPARLADLRARLASARTASPLFDIETYTGHLEAAYFQMAEIERAGLSPRQFAVPAE